MNKESSSFKSTVKATAVFGGAQAIQMIITVLRAKSIAVILGSHGMGINAIFQSTIAIISSLSSFGIFQSAVRDISQVHESGDRKRLSRIYIIFNRMVWITGSIGLLFCLLGSFWLSKLAFQDYNYTFHFVLLSLGVFFSSLSNGQTVFLQGTRSLTSLAKASIIGAVFSLICGVPLFYYYGVVGIVLSIVLSFLILYLTQFYYSRKITLDSVGHISLNETITEAKPIAKLGSVLMLGMVVLTGFTYLTNVYIGRFGRIEDVGLFQGVSSITSQSIAIIIAVLASDFFPRLSAVFQDKEKVQVMVNQQAELVSLIIAPITAILLVFSPIIVRFLLSAEFLIVVPLLRLLALSLLSRGIWLIMSYVILAKGDRKAYLVFDSLIGNGILFILNISAYSYWGLQGLGLSYLLGSSFISLILFVIVKIKYGFNFEPQFLKIFGILLSMIIVTYFFTVSFVGWLQYFLSGSILVSICFYSFTILNKRIGLVDFLKSKLRKS